MSKKDFYKFQHGQTINVKNYDELEWYAHWEVVNRTVDACDMLLPLVDPDLAKTNRSGHESSVTAMRLRMIRDEYAKILQQLDELQREHHNVVTRIEI